MCSRARATIFFYISGHGFGHSIRQIEIINALLAAAAEDVTVCVRTSAAPWLFTRSAEPSIVMLPGEVDTGVVQIDSLRLDETATIELASAFYDELPRRVDVERALLDKYHASLIVSDAAPLACAAGDAAGIPSLVCSNFTWDWIYRDYRDASPAAPLVIARIQELYSLATAGWRLPMHGGFTTFGTLEDVPLVARHASVAHTKDDLRMALGLPRASKLALVSFGGYGVRDLPLERLDCAADWQVVITTRESDDEPAFPGVIALSEQTIYQHGLRYQDVVRAMDIVISKPGYGIISDCIANEAALLYTSRGRFAEYDVLVREMRRFLRCRFISLDDFLAGRWKNALDALDAALPAPERPRTDGAQVVARMMLDRVGASRPSTSPR